MESVKNQINDFLNKCEELKNCKFIMATTKIKDLLKSVVNSAELYQLFYTVSSSFNYLEAKRKCFVDVNDGVISHNYIVLPETVGDRLAFIFCLLVEFDKDTINFNEFLQHYFAEDGSYYSSYHAFCDKVIVSLETLIKEIFAEELAESDNRPAATAEIRQPDALPANGRDARRLSEISLLIAQEKQFILESAIPSEDKEAGYKMLTELYNAVKNANINLIDALVCGYNYYVLYNNSISESVKSLVEAIGEYEQVL